jgi:hypothetical protein
VTTRSTRGVGTSLAILAVSWTAARCAAQDFGGIELNQVMAKLEQMRREGKPIPPPPRLPDGHPDLGNATGSWFGPTIGDMSGHGHGTSNNVGGSPQAMPEKVVEVPFLPWAEKAYNQRQAAIGKDDPEARCVPPGIPRANAIAFPFQIFQLPDRIVILYEKLKVWRIVWMDGRKHTPPDKLDPSFYGESIGRWEGDTLVVDVVGQNDLPWLDSAGHPKTEQLHVVERWRRANPQILHYEATIDDPGAYSKPWMNSWNMLFKPGAELLDYLCVENNPDLQHMVGK